MSDIDDIRAKFQAFELRQMHQVRRSMDATGNDAAEYAKRTHEWQNSSGAAAGSDEPRDNGYLSAERGLQWVPLHSDNPLDGARGALTGQAPHNKWLELAHGSKYEVIQSTIAHYGPEFPGRLRGKG